MAEPVFRAGTLASPAPWWQRPLALMLATSLWLATLGNLALWQALGEVDALRGGSGALLAAGLGLAIAAALLALQSLLAWRWTLKGFAVLLLLLAAVAGHYMRAYHVVIDPTMIVNVLQTNPREAADLITWQMLAGVGLLGVLPAWLVWRMPVDYGPWPRRALHNLGLLLASLALVAGGVMACFQPLSSTMRNHKQLRYLINPLNVLFAVGDVASAPLRRTDDRLRPLAEDARLGQSHPQATRPPLLLLVLGETARSANFGLNGYGRDTTPELARLDVVSFSDVHSCGTSTAASLPCMFSHLGREGWDGRKGRYENLLDVLQRAGLAVLWLDNQAGCKGVCDRVPNANTADTPVAALCGDGECLDEALLANLDARLAALSAERRARGVVLVMHQMGSHGPAYHKRSPPAFKRFMPECTSAALQDCSREQVQNAYDNTIAYTDHMLAGAVGWLKAQQGTNDTALLYLSDHGESLGENGLYLHGLPYAVAPDVQTQVPWISWLSPGWQRERGLDAACLKARAAQPLSHDHLFHTVLGLMAVQTAVYQPQLDAYAACRVR
jgi:lipid A ethanolaminephosphotransferase